VSPFYGTARIDKGFHCYAGMAATSFIAPSGPSYHYTNCVGARADVSLQYGFCKYLQAKAQIAAAYGWSLREEEEAPGERPADPGGIPHGLFDGSIELQGAWPFKSFTPAIILGVTPYLLFSPTFTATALTGIGNPEIVTLGARYIYPYWIDGIVDVHPHPRWSVFAGYRFFLPPSETHEMPVATAGIGYKIK